MSPASQASISTNSVQRRKGQPFSTQSVQQGVLGEDDVGVARGIAVRVTVADEDDGPAGGLVGQHPGPLARAADEAARMAVGEGDPGRSPGGNDVAADDDRHVAHPERLERGGDEEAEAVAHDLDRDAGRPGPTDEGREPGIVGLGRGQGARARPPAAVISPTSHSMSRREPARPASYSAAFASHSSVTNSAMSASLTSVWATVPS